jgi:dipeptidyl aminopeptidase/acylaminoacyl peptidase
VRSALALVVLAACGGAPPAPATPAGPADGDVLERAACPVPVDDAAFVAEIDAYHREDIEQAGLGEELAARPLDTIFTAEERDRLRAAAAGGRCERVIYASGGLRVVGFVLRPPADTAGPHPVMIWLRGGNRDFGQIGPVTLLTLLRFAEAGFVVVATQYRGVDGGEGADEFGGADVDDVLALVPLARGLPGADVERLYVLGGSRGAMQAVLALRRGLPARAVAFRAGMYDLVKSLADRPELANRWSEIMPGWDTDRAGALAERSAIRHVAELDAPVLLLHGRQDWRVDVEDAEAFAAALAAAGKPHELVVYEREEHQLVFHRDEWIAKVVDWFRAH